MDTLNGFTSKGVKLALGNYQYMIKKNTGISNTASNTIYEALK